MIFSIFNKFTEKVFSGYKYISKKLFNKHHLESEELEELEDLLIKCDFDYDTIENIIEIIENNSKKFTIIEIIQNYLNDKLLQCEKPFILEEKTTIIISGTNGSGKTTFIPKLTNLFKHKQFIIAPCDTFRAEASNQLAKWKDINTIFPRDIKNIQNPSAIAFKAIEQMNNENQNATILDTAGRLSNNKNLMLELEKIHNIAKTKSKHTVSLLVMDGTAGQNNINQIQDYQKYITIDGIVITKCDMPSQAANLVFFAAKNNIAIFFLSHGEKKEDLSIFNAQEYTKNIIKAIT